MGVIQELERFADRFANEPGIRHSVMQTVHILRYPMKEILAKIPGETIKERAEAIGVSRQTMYVWANECFRPQVELATRISNLTGVPVWQIRDLPLRIDNDEFGEAGAEAGGRVAQDGDGVPSRKRGSAVRAKGGLRAKPGVGGRARQMRKRPS